MRKRTLPKPKFVTAEHENVTAYAWKFQKYGLQIFADSVAEGEKAFRRAYESEYGKKF